MIRDWRRVALTFEIAVLRAGSTLNACTCGGIAADPWWDPTMLLVLDLKMEVEWRKCEKVNN